MSQTDKDYIQLKDLLGEYKLNKPVPEEIQKHFSKEMAPLYKRILKSAGMYSLLYGIFLSIYFFFKRFGITLTVTKGVVSIFTAVSLSVGGYFLYEYINEVDVKNSAEDNPAVVDKIKPAVLKCTLGVEEFTSSTIDKKVLQSAAIKITSGIKKFRGSHFAQVVKAGQSVEIGYSLMGNIEKVEDTYIMFIKIIDLKNSSIVYAAKEKARSVDELNNTYSKISKNVSSRIK